jgi:hypothetical protein
MHVTITPPPARFEGRFSQFYERYIEPNLPSAESVAAFDLRLRQHLSDADPVHVVRYVRGQTRGTLCRTGEGWQILPTDNAPVWWTHALLHSGGSLAEDASVLFGTMPDHLFKVARFQTLNQAGYHAAHILSAKNRDTDWHSWTRNELARRMLVNIHPCNMFLIAKTEWMRNGGRADIIAWVTNAYLGRYGATMERFLDDGAPGAPVPGEPVEDPDYQYGVAEAAMHRPRSSAAERRPSPQQHGTPGIRLTKRPMIWRDLVGTDAVLDITMGDARYQLPHDDLVGWVRDHTSALETASWRQGGAYHWPRASGAMLSFLQGYRVP